MLEAEPILARVLCRILYEIRLMFLTTPAAQSILGDVNGSLIDIGISRSQPNFEDRL